MEKIIIELEAKTNKALKSIDNVAKSVENLNKEVVSSNQDTAKSLKNVESSSKIASRGIKGIGLALKSAGIGLAIAAFASLREVFMQNQKAADFFNTTFEFISIALNDFVDFIVSNTTTVTDFFSSIFNDPKQAIIDFGNAILENLINRITSGIEVIRLLGSAYAKVFSGNIVGAFEDVKNAGKSYIDVMTGVKGTFDTTVEAVTNTIEAVSDYTSQNIKAAKSNVELANSAELASVKNQGLIEKYDRQAEQQRQIRDDESKSIEDRIKANDELAKILDKQEEKMLKNADIAVASAKAELDKNKENIQFQKAFQEALNERAAIEAQITGFRSEQQTNANSLLREQKEIMSEIALFGKSERDKERLELEQQYEANKLLIEKEITDDAEKKERLLAAETDYKAQLKVLNDGFNAEDLAIKEAASQASTDIAQKETDAKIASLNGYAGALSSISSLIGQETGSAKALAIASSLVNTYASITGQLKAFSGVPVPGYAIAQAVATGLVGFANVKKIANVKIPKSSGGGKSVSGGANVSTGASTPPAVAASIPPAFNIVGASGTNQLASAIGGQSQQPIQAFVVSSEVSSAQELDRNIIEDASIGG
jgi:hypothetical protein